MNKYKKLCRRFDKMLDDSYPGNGHLLIWSDSDEEFCRYIIEEFGVLFDNENSRVTGYERVSMMLALRGY